MVRHPRHALTTKTQLAPEQPRLPQLCLAVLSVVHKKDLVALSMPLTSPSLAAYPRCIVARCTRSLPSGHLNPLLAFLGASPCSGISGGLDALGSPVILSCLLRGPSGVISRDDHSPRDAAAAALLPA